jgi:hypothetical protein
MLRKQIEGTGFFRCKVSHFADIFSQHIIKAMVKQGHEKGKMNPLSVLSFEPVHCSYSKDLNLFPCNR